jgi:hypothetical protein
LRSCSKRFSDAELVIVTAEHEKLRVGQLGAQRADELDAVAIWNVQIDEYDVGLQRGRLLQGVGSCPCLADHEHVGLIGERAGEPFTNDRMIVDEIDLQFACWGFRHDPSVLDAFEH